MKKPTTLLAIFLFLCSSTTPSIGQTDHQSAFRVLPYLLNPSAHGITINWFTENNVPGKLVVVNEHQADTLAFTSNPTEKKALTYSELEEFERAEFPDMFKNKNFKHSIEIDGLQPGTRYRYKVIQEGVKFEAHFTTAPLRDTSEPIRFITFADSETDPAGREMFRKWEPGAQAESSTGRPEKQDTYLVTEKEGYLKNLEIIKERNPAFLLLSGDIVQGGGYQRAWDEFFFHNAGKFDNPLSFFPLIPAIGNWENYGARNGGYEPEAVAASRAKYATYFDAPPNNNSNYRNFYYRVDYGPVTILTLDSSNGLPDSTDFDTNININQSTYPANDLPDLNKRSDQWNWTIEQLKDAREKGQLIFVQFHHIPYSSGSHSLPLTAEGSSRQAGIPMRIYTPEFKKYGVIAVFCGHNESFEHSLVEGIHFYDVGVAGDGLGYPKDKRDKRYKNPYQEWVAHYDSKEHWEGQKLVDGGKHYGHLEVNITPSGNNQYDVRFLPIYSFPVTNEEGKVIDYQRRVYDDEVEISITRKRSE